MTRVKPNNVSIPRESKASMRIESGLAVRGDVAVPGNLLAMPCEAAIRNSGITRTPVEVSPHYVLLLITY